MLARAQGLCRVAAARRMPSGRVLGSLAEAPAFPWLASYNAGCFPGSRVLAAALDYNKIHIPSASV